MRNHNNCLYCLFLLRAIWRFTWLLPLVRLNRSHLQYNIQVITDENVDVKFSGEGGPLMMKADANNKKKTAVLTSAEGGAGCKHVVWGMKLKRLEFGDPNRPRKGKWSCREGLYLGADDVAVEHSVPPRGSTAQDFNAVDMQQASVLRLQLWRCYGCRTGQRQQVTV